VVRLDPQGTGKGNEFVDAVKGGSVPREYIPAVKKGVLGDPADRRARGFPVVDVKDTLFDGSYHEVDSNENAFKMAARWR
jgi:elongation factor G